MYCCYRLIMYCSVLHLRCLLSTNATTQLLHCEKGQACIQNQLGFGQAGNTVHVLTPHLHFIQRAAHVILNRMLECLFLSKSYLPFTQFYEKCFRLRLSQSQNRWEPILYSTLITRKSLFLWLFTILYGVSLLLSRDQTPLSQNRCLF